MYYVYWDCVAQSQLFQGTRQECESIAKSKMCGEGPDRHIFPCPNGWVILSVVSRDPFAPNSKLKILLEQKQLPENRQKVFDKLQRKRQRNPFPGFISPTPNRENNTRGAEESTGRKEWRGGCGDEERIQVCLPTHSHKLYNTKSPLNLPKRAFSGTIRYKRRQKDAISRRNYCRTVQVA